MMKIRRILITAILFSVAMIQVALAAEWEKDDEGLKYKKGSDYAWDEWVWIDRDGSGVQECFYFGRDEYLVTDGETPDGFMVNGNGAWVVNGVVQRKMTGKISNEDITRIEKACAAYYYVNQNLGQVGDLTALSQDRLSDNQLVTAARLAQIAARLSLYPGDDGDQRDGKFIFEAVKFRQIMYDLYGFRTEECNKAPELLQILGGRYYVQAGDFGSSWPYCSLRRTGNTPDGYIFKGTIGYAAGVEGVLPATAKKEGNVYQDQHPVEVQVTYNSDGTFCKYRLRSVTY